MVEGIKKHKKHKKDHSEKKKHKHKTKSKDNLQGIPHESINNKLKDLPGDEEGHGDVMSIAESNKLREQLGLAPLKQDSDNKIQDTKDGYKQYKIQGQTFVHIPPTNLGKIKSTKLIEEKLKTRREKRTIEKHLKVTKTLGESDGEDAAMDWVKKSRLIQIEKEIALKKEKMLQELDEEFGIGNLVELHIPTDMNQKQEYSSKNLKGISIQHSLDSFQQGQTIILTLADKDILNEVEEEELGTEKIILQNVNMVDKEKADMNVILRKTKPGYKSYDDDTEYDELGIYKPKSVLKKYDEEIEETAKMESFTLGDYGYVDVLGIENHKRMEIMKLREGKNIQDLQTAPLIMAKEYYTHEELASFKKPLRKGKKYRNKSTQLIEEKEAIDGTFEKMEFSSTTQKTIGLTEDEIIDAIKEEEEKSQMELEEVINKTRKKTILTSLKGPDKVAEILKKKDSSQMDTDDDSQQKNLSIILNTTSEFCRALGEIPTYGTSGNRENNPDEILDFDARSDPDASSNDESENGDDNEDDLKSLSKTNRDNSTSSITQEPNIEKGLAEALNLVIAKGYIDRGEKDVEMSADYLDLKSKRFIVEDKHFDIDDKHARRDRFSTGPLTDFREKKDYCPDIKLDYIDDQGRALNTKEAFRYMSHKFHGKGSGKNKIEKRTKKLIEERILHQMKSSDTPLNTVNMLWDKQKEVKTPYLVLSGKGQHQGSNLMK